jgi:hypothetical protein
MLRDRFGHTEYVIRQKVLKLFGASFYILGPDGSTVLFSNQKAFKLREDIRLYESEAMAQELIAIRTASIIDFSAAYQVIDTPTQQLVGMLRRKGLSSIVRDQWEVLDAHGQSIGHIVEDSSFLAILRRLFDGAQILLPQTFRLKTPDGQECVTYRQNRNPFVRKLTVDFTPDVRGRIDRRLGLAAGVLLAAIEGRQQ